MPSECVVCGGVLRPHRRYEFKSEEFRKVYGARDVFRCTSCTLSQADMAIVDEGLLSRYYNDQYRIVASAGAASEVTKSFWQQRANALTLLAKENLTEPPERIFEVGAGYGINLMALKEASPSARLFTDEPSQVAKRASMIKTGNLEDGPCDLVIMSHVLEHFTDPKGLLVRVLQALAPRGIAIIEVPNDIDGIERYNGSDEPHVTFFEKQSLSTLLHKISGIEVVDIFEAGPTVVRNSLKRRMRRFTGRVVFALPVIGTLLKKRAAGRVGSMEFGKRNTNGVFLRAVLRKT